METDLTISLNAPDEMVRDSLEAVAEGYTALKLKVGNEVMLDAKRVRAIRAAVGGDIKIRLDADVYKRQSGGLLPNPGSAGNLPSGEAYIVPFEGETEPSLSAGELPVQFGPELVRYRIAGNKAVEVLTQGKASLNEAEHLAREPAYGNLAELGLGVLAAFGVKPVGKVLLDEKLGLHIAFGRSEHFGGQVGPDDFSSPDAVVHIDRVYVPETQPDVTVKSVDLIMADGLSLIHI